MERAEDGIRIERCTEHTLAEWVPLRWMLWPHASEQEHRLEAEALLANAEAVVFLARAPDGAAAGFSEAALRHDFVNGCTTSPVAFLEGIFVRPEYRKQGIARRLCGAVEDWAAETGCSEFASDAELHNTISHHMHAALGFEETERVVYFRKRLSR